MAHESDGRIAKRNQIIPCDTYLENRGTCADLISHRTSRRIAHARCRSGRRATRGSDPRMTRGQCGSLLLHCNGLSPSTSCRSSRRTVAQSHTPCNRCVRFATTVASGHATLATKRTLRLTWTGLPPAGSHQLAAGALIRSPRRRSPAPPPGLLERVPARASRANRKSRVVFIICFHHIKRSDRSENCVGANSASPYLTSKKADAPFVRRSTQLKETRMTSIKVAFALVISSQNPSPGVVQ
jgi:hypothetical protein